MNSQIQVHSGIIGLPNMFDDTLPTRGQLERTLSQRILALYRTELGHQISQISCELGDEKIVIVLEEAITKPEQLLAENGQEELVKQVRAELEALIQPQLKALIEEIVKVPVLDLLGNVKIDTGRSGSIVLLGAPPQFRAASA